MPNFLDDNTVIPSYLGISSPNSLDGMDSGLQNYALRYGEVRDIIYPKDKRNFSGTEIEYEIEVQHREGTGISTSTIYRGVLASDVFGGVGDRVQFTYRKDDRKNKDGIGNGAKVLVLCISGDQQKAIIIGSKSLRVNKADSKHGHHYHFEFNGAKFEIDKDGQILLAFRGATDSEGKLLSSADANAEGSNIRFAKDGSIIIEDGQADQYIKLDTGTTKQIDARCGEFNLAVDNTTNINSQSDVFVDSKAGISLTSTNGTTIGTGSDYMMRGTVYRIAEGALNQGLSKSYTIGQTAAIAASAALSSAASVNAVPMIGGILAMPFLITASIQMGIIASTFGSAQVQLDKFEAGFSDYTSNKNKND